MAELLTLYLLLTCVVMLVVMPMLITKAAKADQEEQMRAVQEAIKAEKEHRRRQLQEFKCQEDTIDNPDRTSLF